MSLEAALTENTAALKALTAALTNGAQTTAAAAGGKAKGKGAVEAPAAPAAPSPAAAPAAGAVSFKQVADVLVPVAEEISRDALVGLLNKFGAKTAQDLKPEQYAAVMTEGAAMLNAKRNPPAATGAAGLI